MKTTSFGVIVGRFQVHELHDGHKELIRTVCKKHDRVIIFLGVSPTLATVRDPLDFPTRAQMILSAFPNGITVGVTVCPLADRSSDEVWSRKLDEAIRHVAPYGDITLYGGRDSFVACYTGHFKPVTLDMEVEKSGEQVRVKVGNNIIASSDFRAGVIYSTQNRFPIPVMCADIACIEYVGGGFIRLLMGKKPDDTCWRFPGGHLNPGETLLMAAQRELHEETGLLFDRANFKVVDSFVLDDWRYRKVPDKMTTQLYAVEYTGGAVKAADDLAVVEWQEINALKEQDVLPNHREMFHALKAYLRRENNVTQPVAGY